MELVLYFFMVWANNKRWFCIKLPIENSVFELDPFWLELGDKSYSKVELQHVRLGGILGSGIMSTEGVVVCNDKEGLFLGQKIFEISKKIKVLAEEFSDSS